MVRRSRREPRRKTIALIASCLVLSACSGATPSAATDVPPPPTPVATAPQPAASAEPDPPPSTDPELPTATAFPTPTGPPAPPPAPTPISLVDRVPNSPYLPAATPDGYVLERVTWIDEQPELVTADPVAQTALVLGDSDVLSDVGVRMSARRFATDEELAHALWVEDGLMVQFSGPQGSVVAGDGTFVYDRPQKIGDSSIQQFHGVVDDVVISGLIFGELSESELARLLGSIVIDPTTSQPSADHDSVGLIPLRTGPERTGPSYELTYGNGEDRFVIHVQPDAFEADLALGSVARDGDRVYGDIGSGIFEAQPEVGGAIGSERLIWWIPNARVQVWFGGVLDRDQAIAVADSFTRVDRDQWLAAIADADADRLDFGPINLPEDPRASFDELLNEESREVGDLGERPEIEIDEISAFIADLRGSPLPDSVTIEWLGPIQADRATSGYSAAHAGVGQVLLALRLIRPSDTLDIYAEHRRRDIRGFCCGVNSVQLVEGMTRDEAAVVAAHELTHLYDVTVLRAQFPASNELFDPGQALREGNANRVMIAYRDAFDLRFDPDVRPHLQLLMPLPVRRSLRFAYVQGQLFAEALADAGGEEAIDAALLDNPPLTTEHILHPQSYLAGDRPIDVAAPEAPADVTVDQTSTMGAFIIALATERELGWDGALELSARWAGDRFVAWRQGRTNCIAATVVFDDAESATTFAEIVGGSTSDARVDLSMCDYSAS